MSNDQCALGPQGNLLEASEINWHYDPDNPEPLPRTAPSTATTQINIAPETAPAAQEG